MTEEADADIDSDREASHQKTRSKGTIAVLKNKLKSKNIEETAETDESDKDITPKASTRLRAKRDKPKENKFIEETESGEESEEVLPTNKKRQGLRKNEVTSASSVTSLASASSTNTRSRRSKPSSDLDSSRDGEKTPTSKSAGKRLHFVQTNERVKIE